MKRLFQILFVFGIGFALSYGGLSLIAYQLVDHFRLGKIQGPLPKKQAKPLPKGIHQPFYYLGVGSQSYVFESADGQYVLKFFRMNRYRSVKISSLPLFFHQMQEQKCRRNQRRRDALFSSCQIAFKKIPKETAMVYLHLEESTNLGENVLVHDALFRPYLVDLDKTPFLIQKKALPTYLHLKKLIDKRAVNEVCQSLEGIKNLLVSRFEKGVADHDPCIEKNMGFIEGRPIFVDIGQFYLNNEICSPATYRDEGTKIVRKLQIWLKEQDPLHADLYCDFLKF